ncbi:retinal pigment epithelial membrane protein-domain-containing protein [Gaertneriomyces semiglobifer]|nr:retinal pigment epithelial membrane protein-domain-containing protein [Gaertneriomyces semiglobifer]
MSTSSIDSARDELATNTHTDMSKSPTKNNSAHRHTPDVVSATTGEPVRIESTVLPGTGTHIAPVAAAEAVLRAADATNTVPPLEVIAFGGQIARAEGLVPHEDAPVEPHPDKISRLKHEQAEARKCFEQEQLAEFEAEQRLEDERQQREIRTETPGQWNVSHHVSPAKYDPRVPYIAGFSNGIEITDPIILNNVELSEEIPQWLRGALYLNGPGLFDIEYISKKQKLSTFSFEHWFDGLALIHRFEIDVALRQVQYRSRFTARCLESLVRQHAQRTHVDTGTELGWLGLQKMESDPSAVSVNFAVYPNFPLGVSAQKDHLILTADTSVIQEIDPVTLIPKRAARYSDVNPAFKGIGAGGTPQLDVSNDGSIVNFVVEEGWGSEDKWRFFALDHGDPFDPPGHVITTLNAPRSYVHTFALTKHFIVLIIFPYKTTWGAGLRKFTPLAKRRDAIHREDVYFDPNGSTTFYVIDRPRRKVVTVYRTGPMFALNIVNAYESLSDQTVYIDLNCYDSDEIIKCWQLENLRTLEMPPWPAASVRRYSLGMIPEASAVYKVDKRKLSQPNFTHRTDYTLEFASVNPRYRTLPYTFAWGLSITPAKRRLTNVIWDCLVKANVSDKTRREWHEDGCYPGPPTMVPKPGSSAAEDEGVVMCLVLDTKDNTSFLLILDSSTMSEVGRARLPMAVPFGFSGSWTYEVHG